MHERRSRDIHEWFFIEIMAGLDTKRYHAFKIYVIGPPQMVLQGVDNFNKQSREDYLKKCG